MTNEAEVEGPFLDLSFDSIVKEAPIPMFLIDQVLNVQSPNKEWWSFIGLNANSDSPNMWLNQFTDESRASIISQWEAISSGRIRVLEVEVTIGSKSAILIGFKVSRGQYFCSLIDTTNYRQRFVLTINALRTQLDQSNQIRAQQSSFSKLVSYHVREPIGLSTGHDSKTDFRTHHLKDSLKEIATKLKELESMCTSDEDEGREYQLLLGDIGYLSNFNYDKIVLEHKPLLVEPLVEQVVYNFDMLKYEVDNNLMVLSDAARLKFLLVYMLRLCKGLSLPPKEVQLHIQYIQTVHELNIVCSYTGRALTESQVTFIFNRFNQSVLNQFTLDSDINIRLFMIKAFVELFEGYLHYESSVPVTGSSSKPEDGVKITFDIRLPMEEGRDRSPRRPQKCNVLIVDDNPLVVKLHQRQLQSMGHNVYSADDGKTAIEMVQTLPIDIVFMDIQLPRVDGLEATRQIREYEKEKGKVAVPIIAMSGFKTEDYENRARAIGATDFFSKPFYIKDMVDMIDKYVPSTYD